MTPAEIIAAVRATGVALTAEGTSLVLKPAGRLEPALRAAVVAQKQAIVALLTEQLADIAPSCDVCGAQATVMLVGTDGSRQCASCCSGATQLRRAGVPI